MAYLQNTITLLGKNRHFSPSASRGSLALVNQTNGTKNFVRFGKNGERRPSVALRATCCAPERIWLAVFDFQTCEQQVDLGQIRSEEIVYSRFIKIPLG